MDLQKLRRVAPTAAFAIAFVGMGAAGVFFHPSAGGYQPLLTVIWFICSLFGGYGAAAAPMSRNRRELWQARAMMGLGLGGFALISVLVMTDALCLGGLREAGRLCR